MLIFVGAAPTTVITDAQTAEEAEVRVTSSAVPIDVNMYLVDDPEQGLVQVSREQCYDFIGQAGRILTPSQVQGPESMQTSDTTSTTIQLNVAGIGGVQQSPLPIDVVIAIDSSGSMKDNDPADLRLEAAKAFVDKLNNKTGEDRSAVVSWDDDIDFTTYLTNDSSVTKMNISNIDSFGDTDLDRGLIASISLLDNTTRNEPSSKAIIFFSDGEEGYTYSRNIGSLADDAKRKGYKIFSFGLNIENGTNEEKNLNDTAVASDGQYYSLNAENWDKKIQAAYDKITEDKSTEPRNINVTEVTHSYITINQSSFSIKPTSILRNLTNNQTIIRWENISRYVGNNDNKLSAGERFGMNFSASVLFDTEGQLNTRLPIWNVRESMVEYLDPSGNLQALNIPQTYINLTSQICEKIVGNTTDFVIEPEPGKLSILRATFIVPGSTNTSACVYQPRESTVFKANEVIELYVDLANLTQKRNVNELNNASNSTNDVSATLTISDEQENVEESSNYSKDFSPTCTKITDTWVSNSSGHVFSFSPVSPPLRTGDYIMNFTITDNLSGENVSVPKNVTIENSENPNDALRALVNAIVAYTNATKALQDKLLKLIEEREI